VVVVAADKHGKKGETRAARGNGARGV
jgi:hypothetical protein